MKILRYVAQYYFSLSAGITICHIFLVSVIKFVVLGYLLLYNTVFLLPIVAIVYFLSEYLNKVDSKEQELAIMKRIRVLLLANFLLLIVAGVLSRTNRLNESQDHTKIMSNHPAAGKALPV